MKTRLLPESAYDWHVRDGRDGETWGPYGTKREALDKRRFLRAYAEPVVRPVFEITSTINERKVLKLIRYVRAPQKKRKR
jgi:hypothetical protein